MFNMTHNVYKFRGSLEFVFFSFTLYMLLRTYVKRFFEAAYI